MCGICGFIASSEINRDSLVRMNTRLIHRGPDDHGEEIYQRGINSFVGLAQRRLSIIDLSERGHQPMHSANGQVSVVFNGEIYNFMELKELMPDYMFRSSSDTEVIIAAYLKWGINFVNRLNGMFAIAIFDRKDDVVYLIRDRIGKKPLYYYVKDENNVAFASEIKSIIECPFFIKEINRNILGRYLYRQCIAAPDTIYKNAYKLEPGGILELRRGKLKKYKYWDIARKYNELSIREIQDYESAKKELKQLLLESVSRRLIADVPVGAFLSGGFDSSLICAIAQNLLSKPIKTFSIGFYEKEYNEAVFAKAVAKHIGSEHEELYISEHEMLDVLESIPLYYDEPFADASQIPTMLVSQLAKQHVSVVLSGDGGDEIFGGYNIYLTLQKAQKKALWGKIVYYIRKYVPYINNLNYWEKMNIVHRIVSDDLNVEAKTQTGVNTYINAVNSLLIEPRHNFYYEFESKYRQKNYDITRMLLDMDTYLPDDILTKVDRASMKYSLECRCPLLDKEVIEYAFKLPMEYKVDGGTKKILKDITYEYIPREIMDRPKAGFSIPLDKWLRGALRDKLMDWTEKKFLEQQGIFNADFTKEFIISYLQEGDKGKWSGLNYSKIVWPYFIFQQWYEKYM